MHTLKSYRQQCGIRQSDLADDLGVDQGTISKLEAGAIKPSLDLAIKIEDATQKAVPVRTWIDTQESAEAGQ